MKTKLFDTAALIAVVLLLFVCSTVYIIFPPENPGWIYFVSLIVSLILSVGVALLITMPRRTYMSTPFKILSWSYVTLFSIGTAYAIWAYGEAANAIADLEKILNRNIALSGDQNIKFQELLQTKTTIELLYFCILSGASIVWFFILRSLRKSDKKYADIHHIIDKEQEKLLYSERMMLISDRYKALCKEKDAYPISNYKIERLANEIYYLTERVLDLPNAEQKLENIISTVAELVNSISDAKPERMPIYNNEIKKLVDEHLIIIREFKELTETN